MRFRALLPSACALCGCDGAAELCEGCRRQFLDSRTVRCGRCGLQVEHEASMQPIVCGACLDKPPAFDATVVGTDYAAPFDRLVLGLKFNGRLELAPAIAGVMRDALLRMPAFALPDCIVPVPLSRGRLAERGFNQALELARPLSRSLGIRLQPRLLERIRETQAQSLLPPEGRRANMRRAFAIGPAAALPCRGLHIGVVDDVMTTGETLNAVARTLKRAGVHRVTNFVFARTPPKR